MISFATSDMVLSATGKYHGSVGIYMPNCTVLQPKKLHFHLFSRSYRPFRLINIYYYTDKTYN